MPKKTWSNKDLAYIERVAGKVPVQVMALALNKTAASFYSKGYSLGLKLHVPMKTLLRHWPEYAKRGPDATA